MGKRRAFAEAAEIAIGIQNEVAEAEITTNGDVSDPGDLGLVVTILECLASGDEGTAAELLLTLANSIKETELGYLNQK